MLKSEWSASADRFRAALKSIGHKGIVKPAGWALRVQREFFSPQEGGTDKSRAMEIFRKSIAHNVSGNSLQDAMRAALPAELMPPETMGTPTARVPEGAPVPAGTEKITGVAPPAVEPKSIEPALRNCSAFDELLVCTQRTAMPSLASSFSR